MLIILARHADRETRKDRRDIEQELTAKGAEQAVHLGQALSRRLNVQGKVISLVLTSPYQRTIQTAQLMAQELGLPPERVQILDALAPDIEGSVDATMQVLSTLPDEGVILVGHGPDLASMARKLCGQAVELNKAHSMGVEKNTENGESRLLWLVSHNDY
ncbi:MAG: sixA [Chloroflexi bacterium]|jgi:phosphohistidine phosphatase|nr:sixA [Chloroflexota bacterium]